MPTSQYNQIPKIIELICIAKPSSVMDVGAGHGKYGFLTREYLDISNEKTDYNSKDTQIDAIEAFEKYITPIHKHIYNHIYVGDLKDKIKIVKKYDLVLIIDVLEHFKKEDANKILNTLIKNNKIIILSVPKNVTQQEDCYNNPYERHKSRWKKKDFKKIGNCFFIFDNSSYILYLTKNKKLFRQVIKDYKKLKLKKTIKYLPLTVPIYRFLKRIVL